MVAPSSVRAGSRNGAAGLEVSIKLVNSIYELLSSLLNDPVNRKVRVRYPEASRSATRCRRMASIWKKPTS